MRDISFTGRRIRTFLALFAFALTVPLLLVSVVAFNQMARLQQAETEQRVSQAAHALAARIDAELDRATVVLETLATSPALKQGDLRAFHNQSVLALKRSKAAIVLIDRDFQQLVDTLKDYGSSLPKTGDPETAKRVFESKRRQVSNLFRGSISGRPVINVEVPVLDDAQEVRFVLIMSFQAAHIADLLRDAELGPPWISGVTDNNGIILARSERHDDFVGQPLPAELLAQSRTASGVFRATNVAGDEIIRATSRSQVAGWLVSATVPTSYVDEPSRRGQLFAGLLLGTGILVGLALAYLFGRFMTRPLDAATRAAAAVGEGKVIEPIRSSLFEANVLTDTLSRASLEIKRRGEHSEFLMRELAHRAKNQLAIVKGIALQTARHSNGTSEFLSHFTKRIQALAQTQDLLVRQNWQGASMKDLVVAQLDLFGVESRATVEGPQLLLDATAVQNIGFALHELATNASKHGALSSPNGSVSVKWSGPESDGRIKLDWIEMDGPTVSHPLKRGFGHRVVTELVPAALQGSASLIFTPSGIRWHLDIPATYLMNSPQKAES
jgi:two-component sensor histidine kinase